MKLLLALFILTTLGFANIELPDNFQADFIQKITNTKAKLIEYKGKVHFSNEKLFKWSYTHPTQKEVCTNGKELRVVDHDLEQVSEYRIAKKMDIANILAKAKIYKDNVYVAEYENKKYTIQLHHNKLQSIAYYDELENKVQIVFSRMKYGKGALPKKMLHCAYPKNYDMIRG